MSLQTRQKLSSLGPIFAFDAPRPTGSYRRSVDFGVEAGLCWKLLQGLRSPLYGQRSSATPVCADYLYRSRRQTKV